MGGGGRGQARADRLRRSASAHASADGRALPSAALAQGAVALAAQAVLAGGQGLAVSHEMDGEHAVFLQHQHLRDACGRPCLVRAGRQP